MEARKVQRVGQTTLAVSLPKPWTEDVGLRQGDTILLEREKDDSLRLIPSQLLTGEEATETHVINADLCSEPKMLERVIVGNYILGRDTIWITSSSRLRSSHIEEARKIATKLMGLAIMEETSKRILLQCSIDPSKFPMNALIRRLYIIASTMHKEAIQALVDGDFDLAEDAMLRESEADTVYWLIVRLLLSSQQDRSMAERIGIVDSRQIIGNKTLSSRLERIADWAEIIAKDVIEIRDCRDEIEDSLIDRLSKISSLADDVCSKAMQCLYTRDVKLANMAIEAYEDGVEAVEGGLVRDLAKNGSNARAVPYLRRVILGIRRIAELGAEISQTTINLVLQESSELCETRQEVDAALGSELSS